MPKKFKRSPDPEVGEVPAYLGLTPNQVVAYNLTRAREDKGWTQDEAADALAPYLGKRWSKASVSQAERSIAGKFIRKFDADEILAFARAFELPVSWFLMPPPPWSDQPGVPVKLSTPDAERFGAALGLLVDLVFGDPGQQALLLLRLQSFLNELGPLDLTEAQQRIASAVNLRVEALVAHSFQGLGQWQTMLRSIANQLEDLEVRAKAGRTSEENGATIDELVSRQLELDDEEPSGEERLSDEGPHRPDDERSPEEGER
ncbi:MAG TPA: helix-turn-helix transcriptional regulator [Acidimicrobiales bacterium]|nr:helix-turn-helix transcriptional regulator [Acidimicrobiales bacterium]